MELIVEEGHEIPNDVATFCVSNSLDDVPDGTHDGGFGGAATTLAILAASQLSSTPLIILKDTYAKVVTAMWASESIDDRR